jgi:hypothetical protein
VVLLDEEDEAAERLRRVVVAGIMCLRRLLLAVDVAG